MKHDNGTFPKAVVNARCVIDSKVVEGLTLLFDDTILKIGKDIDLQNAEIIDAKGAYLAPGFIDMHIHGSGGADVMDATPEALETISRTLSQTGTTAFLATTMTMAQEDIVRALENVRLCKEKLSGAQVLGVHLEGPFINTSKHRAQDAAYVQPPQTEWIEPYLDVIRMVTLAPEVENGAAFISWMKKRAEHVILSIGHSDATYEATCKSFDAGISHVTHLFNAMPPYHHREPGIVGACFDREEVTCDIIADLVHTHPHHLNLVYRMKGDKVALITDAMRAGCMKSGISDLGGRAVHVLDGKAVLEDGTLAGSVLRMNEALGNMVAYTQMTLPEAVASVTQLPAEKLYMNKGRLEVGYDADLVIFDEDFSIITTIVAGEVIYQRSV
jgi:N-acetylglucosamine-6-phosphate deacetylase